VKLGIDVQLLILIFISTVLLILRSTVVKELDNYVRKNILSTKTPFMEELMKHVSRIGDRDIAMGIMVLIWNDQVRVGSFIAVALGMAIAQIVNIIVGQKRPPGPLEYKPLIHSNSYHSMVSGHSTGSFAFATVLAHYYPGFSSLAFAVAIIVATSRLYKDKHWFSNLLLGLIIGSLSGVVVLNFVIGNLIFN
jgi:undecaprenyl-diphosphatase